MTMANTIRPQRFGELKNINAVQSATVTADALVYEPGSGNFKLSIFTSLKEVEPFADLKHESFEVRGILANAPELCPLDQARRQRVEFEGTIYTAYVLLFRPILPIEKWEQKHTPQLVGLLLDSAGKVFLKSRIEYGGEAYQIHYANAVKNLIYQFLFQRDAKKVPPSAIKTTVLPVDEDTLTHHFVASVNAGFTEYKLKGDVSDLKKRGLFKTKADYFQDAWVWSPFGKPALIAKDSGGVYHITNGKTTQKHPDFFGSLNTAINQTTNGN